MIKGCSALAATLALTAVFATATPALARGWDCDMVGGGDQPAHYIAHFRVRGRALIEPHWPAAVAYRIVSQAHGMLVAVHAYTHPAGLRNDAGAVVTVLVLNTRNGRLHRATTATGEDTDTLRFGRCQPQR